MSRCKGSKLRKLRVAHLPRSLRKLFASKLGIDLDVGCGEAKQKNFVGMDIRKVPGVDILHDACKFPWPIPSSCCNKILLSHMWEHIKPWLSIKFMDELWRVMKEDGQLLISTPYATSFGYYQDPTHCNPSNEATWTYFDPAYFLYTIYKPKPWKIVRNVYQMNHNMEVILEKRKSSKLSKEEAKKKKSEEKVIIQKR